MKTINRTAITIRQKQPYINWANSFDDGGPTLDIKETHPTTFLIPDKFDEFNYEKFLKKNYTTIFEHELWSWMTDPDTWPEDRSYKNFKKWFEVIVSEIIVDLDKGDVTAEEY